MSHSNKMELNKLSYEREREVVEFSLRRILDDRAIVISGEVPLVVLSTGDVRPYAKAAVRQALLDAADALSDLHDAVPDEGTRPESLNASNDD